MIAIITTSKQVFENYRLQHGLDKNDVWQIAKRTDLIKHNFSEVIDLDDKENVTEAVRKRIGSSW